MHEIHRREQRRHIIRMGVAFACAGNVMLIAFGLYGGHFAGIQDEYRTFLRWISLGLTLISLLWPGWTFFVGAWSSVRTRMMHMDVPVAIALTLGTIWGAVNTMRGAEGGEVYFDSITVVIFLLLVGRWLQHRQQRSATDAIELLYTLTPSTARRLDAEGEVRTVPVEALRPADRCELRAGDSAPADGEIVDGASAFDLSMLTGESRPVTLEAGDLVHAGAVNLGSRIVMSVEAVGGNTRIGRLMQMVERFARDRPPIVRLADRVAHWFVITVLILAAATAGLWLWLDPSHAVEHAITLLIVTCPCALGLATPLALVGSIGRAARAGILIKGGEALEQLARPGVLVLDKTGTLTQGRMSLVSWEGDTAIQPSIVAIERQVAHPIADAFVAAFDDVADEKPSATVRHVLGGGVEGIVDGRVVLIGSPAFVRERVAGLAPWVSRAERKCAEDGLSPVFIADGGTIIAVAGFGDPVLDDAIDSIDALRAMGWKIRVLSGDHDGVVSAVARSIGVAEADAEGGALPEHKASAVQALRREHDVVVMVGDGVNDAAALSAASVGVAVHGGAEASLAAADIFLRRPGLQPIVELMHGARRSVNVIKSNLALSLAYNVVTASLAIGGVITPVIAAVLMPVSSLTVVTISTRARTFRQ
jgi:Cu2+-exporting ATPase